MKPTRIEFFKDLLEQRRRALAKGAGAAIGQLTDDREALADSVDIASDESDRDFSLRLQDRDRQLLHKIDAALARVEEGVFGICVVCGEDISEKRLLARPMATHCIDCKTEAEQMERPGTRG